MRPLSLVDVDRSFDCYLRFRKVLLEEGTGESLAVDEEVDPNYVVAPPWPGKKKIR